MDSAQRRHRILVVDDDNALREAVARQLRRSGHLVTTAENAEAALAHTEVGRDPYDVVVTDVHLPSMSGVELTGKLLQRRPTQRVVVMTGDSDPQLASTVTCRGAVRYLLKPFELSVLAAMVDQSVTVPRYVARDSAREQKSADAIIGTVPAEWLLWVDDRSNAGIGHGDRVARTARVIASGLSVPFDALALAELEVSAWSHELGLLAGLAADPVELAWRSAQMLEDCVSNDSIVKTVRHMSERWDGRGGPRGLRDLEIPVSSQVLAAADAVDHYTSMWVQAGTAPAQACERAITLITAQPGTTLNPAIVETLAQNRAAVASICGVARRAPVARGALPARALPFELQVKCAG